MYVCMSCVFTCMRRLVSAAAVFAAGAAAAAAAGAAGGGGDLTDGSSVQKETNSVK